MKRIEPKAAVAVRTSLAAALALGSFAAVAAPGDPLGPAVFLPGNATAFKPVTARQANGDFVIIHGENCFCAKLFNADGTEKGIEVVIGPANSRAPQVAMDSDGDFIVTWGNGAPLDPAIVARRFNADGTPQGDVFRVSEPVAPGAGGALIRGSSVAMDDDGDFVIGWDQGRVLSSTQVVACAYGIPICLDVGQYSVRLRRFHNGVAEPVQVVDTSASVEINLPVPVVLPAAVGTEARGIDVSMAADGSFAVAWYRPRLGAVSPSSGIYARRYSATGAPGLTRKVSQRAGVPTTPAIAVDAQGGFTVAYALQWQDLRREVHNDIYARSFDANGVAAAERTINEADTVAASASTADIAMAPGGSAVIVWNARNALGVEGVVAQRFADGGGLLGGNFSVFVPAVSFYNVRSPSVASDAAGNFVVTWSERSFHAGYRLYEGP